MPEKLEKFYDITTRLVFFMVLASMGFYYYVKIDTRPQYNDKGEITKLPTPDQQRFGLIVTTIYSVLVVVLGNIYKELAR